VTVALLLFIGWATSNIETFDQRAVLAWLLATPARASPRTWRSQFAAAPVRRAGAQRVAVIAGASGSGARSRSDRSNPLLGIRVAGFFDDRVQPAPVRKQRDQARSSARSISWPPTSNRIEWT